MAKAINKSKIFSKNAESATSSSGVIHTFKQTLTAAQVKNSFSSPVELIAAPGANKVIYIDWNSICIKLSTGTAFNFAGGGTCNIGYGPSLQDFLTIPEANINDDSFLTTAGGFTFTVGSGSQNFGTNSQNLAIKFYNTLANSVNGTRTLTIVFNYYIIDLS